MVKMSCYHKKKEPVSAPSLDCAIYRAGLEPALPIPLSMRPSSGYRVLPINVTVRVAYHGEVV